MFFDFLRLSNSKGLVAADTKTQDKEHDKEIKKFLKNILGCKPGNILLYRIALIHKSKSHKDAKGYKINNERLEYLGDTVLSTIVGDFLFKKYPHHGEGFLTEMRSKIVSRASLNQLAKKIGLLDLIECNKGGNTQYISMSGDAFEAITGALYLDKGYDKTYKILINRILTVYVDVDSIENSDWNYKSKIIDWAQKTKRKISFEVINIDESAPRKQYKVEVRIDDVPQLTAVAFSIRAAEQLSAEKTFKKLVEQGVIDLSLLTRSHD
ncbi:MAG: ribonuclease III [Bacteroidales bacterium]|nr:ribonuclease III [Candidatus Scybalousia scybalohippi]